MATILSILCMKYNKPKLIPAAVFVGFSLDFMFMSLVLETL